MSKKMFSDEAYRNAVLGMSERRRAEREALVPVDDLKLEFRLKDSDSLHEITYEAVKKSELFSLLENWEVDVKADQLHDEVVKFMEQWIEKEVEKKRSA